MGFKLSSINPMVISGDTIYAIDINSKLMSIDRWENFFGQFLDQKKVILK